MADDAGSTHPFEEEALRWLPQLLRYAQSLTRDRSDAEDLVQDTYLIAQQSWHQFQHGTDSRAWLFTIARNRFFRLHQRAEREVPTGAPELESLAMAEYMREHQHSIADSFEGDAIRAVIRRSMYALPEIFREVVFVSERCTEHIFAISSNRCCCDASRGPRNSNSLTNRRHATRRLAPGQHAVWRGRG